MESQYAAFRRDSTASRDTADMSKNVFLAFLACASTFVTGHAMAAQTIGVDPAECRTDRLFGHGFGETEDVEKGLLARTFAGRNYFLVVPSGYQSDRQYPLLMALHGTGGTPAGAVTNAQAIAQTWQEIARTRGMVVVVPIGSSTSGSWSPPADLPYLQLLQASIVDEFRIDPTRQYLWGFSAGGHFGHGVVLQRSDVYAAYAIAAGVLRGYACDAATCPAYLAAVPRHVPLDLSSGIGDGVVPISEISADEGRFRDAGWQIGSDLWVRGISGQGHTYSTAQLTSSWDTICRFAVVPGP